MRIERDPKEGRILDRTQLALYALLLSLFWLSGAVLASNFRASQNQSLVEMALRVGIWLLGPALAVILLSYIEAVGVAWFSRRRGWRVAFRTAERVVSYSMIGWLPASIVCCVMYLWYGGLLRWPLPAWLFPGDYRDLFVLTLVGSISILWFETLVWLGVREVKFANGR